MITTNINTLLDPFHKEDLDNTLHPSIYLESEHYNLLILRFPLRKNGKIVLESQGFVILNQNIYHYDTKTQTFITLESGWQSLYEQLDEIIDNTLALITALREQIMDIEQSLYSQKLHKMFLTIWFEMKQELIVINRILMRTLNIYEQFYKKNQSQLAPLIHNYHDLFEHLSRSQRYVEHDIEKLNTVYSFYSARNNDKMNYSIYVLTILSAIFLPLNLMVGFFGMNTGSLPFRDDGGTLIVSAMLGVTTLILVLFMVFKRK